MARQGKNRGLCGSSARTPSRRGPADRTPAHRPGLHSAGRRKPKDEGVHRISRQLQRLLARDRVPIVPRAGGALAPREAPKAAAKAKLTYVSDAQPGIRRQGGPKHFTYVRPRGGTVVDRATLTRIARLAIPPAWTEVWICPDGRGHVQATGRDARGRKQYRYHPRWRLVRDQSKFGRMIDFARTLPKIRRAVADDLRAPGLSRRKVLAGVVRLLERTCIRIGNDEYARTNRHFGITTLQDQHAKISRDEIRFRFRGKSGKEHEIDLQDHKLARLVRRCRDLPGQRLFQYFDKEGRRHNVGSGDVNDYLREVTGSDFTAKDFRTWAGTTLVAASLIACGEPESVRAGQRQVLEAIDAAAARLGNTRAVCRSSYVHPAVLDAFMEGRLRGPAGARAQAGRLRGPAKHDLDPLERATLRVLEAASRPRAAAVADAA
jgi:DNA topoisomerase I